jgi:Uma2 family endonuclease
VVDIDEPELHLRSDVLVPDIAGWRRERMPKLPSKPAFELAPDWVCEVISPSTAKYDRSKKMRVYSREQVPWLWLIDPLAQTLEVFQRMEEGPWKLLVVHGEDTEKVRVPPFDAIELELKRWWPE